MQDTDYDRYADSFDQLPLSFLRVFPNFNGGNYFEFYSIIEAVKAYF